MKRGMRFGCLLAAAAFAFFTFTFTRADETADPRARVVAKDPRGLRVLGTAPVKISSAPIRQQTEAGNSPVASDTDEKDGSAKKSPVLQPKKYQPAQFLKLLRDENGKPKSMQTAVVRYVPAKGKSDLYVDLVSVVHVGDRRYYSQLNKLFEDYDVVLYELVAPKDVRPPKGGKKSNNPLSMLQEMITIVLQLDLQTKCIDYTSTNFVHADLSPKEMAAIIKKRGDNALTLGLSIVADMIREYNKQQLKLQQNPGQAPPDPLKLLLDPQAPTKLKVMMAEQMAQMGNGTGLGKTLTQLLIDDRNKACMKVFQQQLVQGKKKIAIFYGAAHMPDFERRLIMEYGMTRDSVQWFTAWDLTPRPINWLELMKYMDR